MSVWGGRGRGGSGGANGVGWGNRRGRLGNGNGNNNNNAAPSAPGLGTTATAAARTPSAWPAPAAIGNENPWNRQPPVNVTASNNSSAPNGSANANGSLTAGVQHLQIRNIPPAHSNPEPMHVAALAPSRQQPRQEEGRRGRRPTYAERNDFVATRANITHLRTKMGSMGMAVSLVGNYFKLNRKPDWCIFHYHVDFRPEQTNTKLKKGLIDNNKQHLGGYVTDGSSIWTAQRLVNVVKPLLLTATTRRGDLVEMEVKLVGEIDDGDPRRLQIFNVITRSCFGERDGGLGLVQNRRNYYDPQQGQEVTAARRSGHATELVIWPGYVTTLRHYDLDLMLNVGIKHKIIRNETCLGIIRAARSNQDIEKALVGAIVMTGYNNKSYKIADVDFNKNPMSSFSARDGSPMTYLEYYQTQHQVKVRDTKQPLLMAQLKKKDFHRGADGVGGSPGSGPQFATIYLIPELCKMTGITESERTDSAFMTAVNKVVMQSPDRKLDAIQTFIKRLQTHAGVSAILRSWELEFERQPTEIKGRLLPGQGIIMKNRKNGQSVLLKYGNSNWMMSITGDARSNMEGKSMEECKKLQRWVVIRPSSVEPGLVQKLLDSMKDVARGLGFTVEAPLDIVPAGQSNGKCFPPDLQRAIQATCVKHKEPRARLDLVLVILPNDRQELYAAAKKECCSAGVQSQCIVAGTIRKDASRFKSVATKVVIQINAKLGGVPWNLEPLPFQGPTMVVGFDVYHCGKASGRSVSAMVATHNKSLSRFYSTATWQERGQELNTAMCVDITKCVDAFCKHNGGKILPGSIVFFRDGVGEGQLYYVVELELQAIRDSLSHLYAAANKPPPKLTFIVVTKRINARFFKPDGKTFVDAAPGTVVDTVATQPERFDFFLTSVKAPSNGMATPTSYNVIWDDNKFSADFIQQLAFRQCHAYYNWSGTVSVPAVCQYAHKLAYLAGTANLSLKDLEPLSDTLYYL